MKKFFEGAVIFGVVIYLLVMLAYGLGKLGFYPSEVGWLAERVVGLLETPGREYTFGIPIAGVVTTVVVYLFGLVSPGPGNNYTFKAFSLEFSGPAAPATIWIFTFLTFVATIKLLRP